MHTSNDIVIIGSGPAGCTAAIYAARAGLSPIMAMGLQPGGQLTMTTDVENWPGATSTNGTDLTEQLLDHAQAAGAKAERIIIERIEKRPDGFMLHFDGAPRHMTQAIILATGARAKWLEIPSEEAFSGRGVSACATCDGFFFRKRKVAVIGGGNTAVEEAIYLSGIASHVSLIHRRDELRAEKIMIDRLMARDNVDVRWEREVDEILGDIDAGVTGLRIRPTGSPAGSGEHLDVDGVFVAIGHAPASELVKDLVDTDPHGFVVVEKGSSRTSMPGIFAAGDIADPIYRQAVTSAGMGCQAALDAARWLSGRQGG
jgi:thioredoxin reductase (NADPH)